MPKVEANGIMIDYVDEGEGTPLVIVHGLGSSHRDWEDQVGLLARYFRVIAPSVRGFGDSEKPDGMYSVKTWSEDLIGLMDHLHIPEFHLMGFSMGGAISYQTAVDFQERLKSLIIINSQPSFELNEWYKQMMVLSRIGMARVAGMPRLARFVAKRLFPEEDQADLRRRMIERHQHNDQSSYINAVQALAGWSVADRINSLQLPVLILAADMDYTPLEDKLIYLYEMENVRLEIVKNSRHVSHIDQPQTVYALIRDFVKYIEGDPLPEAAV
ncbi:MAG: alpha/beta fold hydrolase [Gammaproteobacteria bacterium]|nr:alpha/beta fold hydrolase [Gammaproteobacteria bacterium]